MSYSYLEEPIIEYIKKGKFSSIDVVAHFGLGVDITLIVLKNLVTDGRVTRVDGPLDGWSENYYYKEK